VGQGAREIDELALSDGQREPRSLTLAPTPSGSDSMKSASPISQMACSTVERSMSGVPKRTLDSMVPVKRKGSWRTMPNRRRKS